tara:strand:+ start:572 stop:1000 length:429 start_codon:yes stop_codon:yes gene_type:complete
MSEEKKYLNKTRKGDDRDWVRGRMNPDARLRDPTIPAANERKKIMFYDTAKRRTDLNIKLKYDNLKQSEFFRMMITGYLDCDPHILSFVEEYKEEMEIHNVAKRRKSKALRKKSEETKKNFSLDDSDIEDLFDIIAEEHPDL